MKNFKNIILGLILLAIIIKFLPLGLMILAVYGLYKKQYLGKKLRLFVSSSLIFVGLVGALIMSLPDTTTTTTETAQKTTKQAAPAVAPVVEEKKAEAPKEAPKPSNIILTLDQADVMQHIKDNAKADWATDFEEQKYVINEQTQAYNNLKTLVIDTPEKELILNQAHSDWGYDFEETLYIYNEQLKAYNELNK